jgi:hypothetical protein
MDRSVRYTSIQYKLSNVDAVEILRRSTCSQLLALLSPGMHWLNTAEILSVDKKISKLSEATLKITIKHLDQATMFDIDHIRLLVDGALRNSYEKEWLKSSPNAMRRTILIRHLLDCDGVPVISNTTAISSQSLGPNSQTESNHCAQQLDTGEQVQRDMAPDVMINLTSGRLTVTSVDNNSAVHQIKLDQSSVLRPIYSGITNVISQETEKIATKVCQPDQRQELDELLGILSCITEGL